jgi:GNAT superfamily N-acetyltransferase
VPVSIRDATDDDIPSLRDVYRRASLTNEGDREMLLGHPQSLEYVAPQGAQSRCRVALADSGALIGFATTTGASDLLELEDLFVDPTWMRRGVGRSLIDDVVVYARSVGITRVEVDGNPHALAFYTDAGFKVDATVTTEFGFGYRLHLDADTYELRGDAVRCTSDARPREGEG